MAFIELKNVSFEYKGENQEKTKVLDGLDLEIEEGSFVTVLGRNGSGKSTAARIINSLLTASSGEVLVDGLSPSSPEKVWEIRTKVGMVFQNPDNQIVESVVSDDVAFGCENLGLPSEEIKKRVKESLSAVGMAEHYSSAAAYLSGGEKQRVAIAGVIAMKPKCIIFDESTSMLDPCGRKAVLEIMKRLNKDGVTVINITHFMEEALESEKIIIIDRGKKVREGEPSEIFADIDGLKRIKLDVPQIFKLSELLREKGFSVPSGITTKEMLLEAMKKYKFKELPEKQSGDTIEAVESVISLENVSYTYARNTIFEKEALREVTADIPKGGFTAIVGHTGSGKSTLMQMLNGLIKADSGSVLYMGDNIYSGKDKLRLLRQKVGLVFQYPEYQLFEDTVYSDIAFAPKNKGLSAEETDKTVKSAMRAVGLDEKYAERSPFLLSGGEKRRVAIAGVLAMEPEVLVLDEPAAALDPAGKKEIFDFIDGIHKERGITIVIVSHSMDDAAKYADNIILMNKGRLVFSGNKEEAFSKNIENFSLSLPFTSEITEYFTENGYNIPKNIYNVSALAEALAERFESGISPELE